MARGRKIYTYIHTYIHTYILRPKYVFHNLTNQARRTFPQFQEAECTFLFFQLPKNFFAGLIRKDLYYRKREVIHVSDNMR